jgi:hypothetical protein
VKEPRRLLSETDTSPLAHSMLAAGRARRERDGARERVWGAVGVAVAGGAALAATSATASASAGASASASAGASASASAGAGAGAGASAGAGAAKGVGVAVALTKLKVVVAAVLIATTAAGGAAYVAREQSRDNGERLVTTPLSPIVQTARISSPLPPSEPVLARADVLPVASAEATTFSHTQPEAQPDTHPTHPTQPSAAHARVESKPRPIADAAKSVSISELREEAAMLGAVRSALAAGDGGTAAARLDEARVRFPRTRLGQERDALEVRVAIANGDGARASALARAFVARYPDSPLRPGIEASIAE